MRMVTLGEIVLVLVRKIRLGESGSFGFRSSPADRFPFLFSIMVRGGRFNCCEDTNDGIFLSNFDILCDLIVITSAFKPEP